MSKEVGRKHRFLGERIPRQLAGPPAKPGAKATGIVGRESPAQKSSAYAGQNIPGSAGSHAWRAARVVRKRLAFLSHQSSGAFEQESHRKLGRKFLNNLSASFTRCLPESRHFT